MLSVEHLGPGIGSQLSSFICWQHTQIKSKIQGAVRLEDSQLMLVRLIYGVIIECLSLTEYGMPAGCDLYRYNQKHGSMRLEAKVVKMQVKEEKNQPFN